MRIDCEQCRAAYAIDDAMIGERGIRAQCPKCGHQKVVKKPTAGPTLSPFGAPGFGAPAAPSAPTAPSPQAAANPFGGAPGFGPPKADVNPFAAPSADPFAGLGAPGPSPAPNPFGGAPTPRGQAPAVADPFAGLGLPDPSGGAAASPFGATPSASPFGASPSASPFGASPSASPFGATPSASPFGAPSPSASPFGAAPSPFGGAPAAGAFGGGAAAPDPFAALGAQGAANPFGSGGGDPFAGMGPDSASAPVTDPGPASFTEPASSFLASAAANQGTYVEPPPGGGAAPDDPFARMDIGAGDAAPAAPGGAGRWHVRTKGGLDAEVDLPQLRDMLRRGEVKADDEAAPLGAPLRPVSQQSMLALPKREPVAPRAAGARASARPALGRPIAIAAGVVAVVALVAAVVVLKPDLFERGSDAGVNPLRRVKPAWSKQFPDIEGTAGEHLTAGVQQMQLDSAAGYRRADEHLKQALLLDLGNVAAIGAFVENFANLPAVKADLDGTALAQEAIAYGLRRAHENAALLRADGALKLALGDVDAAQHALLRARQNDPNDMQAVLWFARSELERSPSDALALVQNEVLKKAPTLQAAHVLEGAALRRLGNLVEARAIFDKRLQEDPTNTAALKELARLELDVGEPAAAIAALDKLLAAEGDDVDAHLMRAKIAYQTLDAPDRFARADAYLAEVLTKHEKAAGELLLPVLAHAAYVKGELGQLQEAQALGERVRATDGSYAPGLFVLGRIYAKRNDLDAAKTALDAAVRATQARDQYYEMVARTEYARVLVLAGNLNDGLRNYQQVIAYDPRYTRAFLGLGAAYMGSGQATQAMTIMRRALQNDPAFAREHVVLTDYPVSPNDLAAFADAFAQAVVPKDDPSLLALKLAAEGVQRFYAGDVPSSEKLMRKALAEDQFNHPALLFLGAAETLDGRFTEGKRSLKTAVDTTAGSHAITRLYLARAMIGAGETDAARNILGDLEDQEPTLVQAAYQSARLLIDDKQLDKARAKLKKIVQSDPDYTPAKRALAKLGA